MPELLKVGPAPFIIIVISIALITLVYRQLPEIREWRELPIIPSWRITRKFQYLVTVLRLTYFFISLNVFISFIALIYFISNGQFQFLATIAIWALLLQIMFIGVWTIFLVYTSIEKPQTTSKLPVQSSVHQENE